MNILPKKRWHVRTKENIERVRRDERQAAKELEEVERRSKLADQEARTKFLREKAKLKFGGGFEGPAPVASSDQDAKTDEKQASAVSIQEAGGHVNFFAHLEAGETTANTNKEHEEEKKKEQEDYEKKMGILVGLGQDSQELTGEKSWWQTIERQKEGEELGETSVKRTKKQESLFELNDPMKDVRDYMGCKGIQRMLKKEEDKKPPDGKKRKRKASESSGSEDSRSRKHKKSRKSSHKHKKSGKKSKKSKKSSSKKKKKRSRKETSSSDGTESEDVESEGEKRRKLEKLREERLIREKKERIRTDKLLYGKSDLEEAEKKKQKESMSKKEQVESQRKYNNQFNPHLAKQNRLDAKTKYWLEGKR